MPQKHQPDYPYLRHVRIARVHLFTFIQILSLAGMFAVKNVKSIAIVFPLLVNRKRARRLAVRAVTCACRSSRLVSYAS